MIDIEKLGRAGIDKLAKAGKAVLVFRVKKHPADYEFDRESVAIELYIVPRSPDETSPPETLPDSCFKGMISHRTERTERTFAVEVESLFGIWARWRSGKKKREPRLMWIVAEPAPDCKGLYERTFYPKTLEAGGPIPLEISLRPRSFVEVEESQEVS